MAAGLAGRSHQPRRHDTRQCALSGLACHPLMGLVDAAVLGADHVFLRFWRVAIRSEEHTSELQSLMRTSYAVFCLKKKQTTHHQTTISLHNTITIPHTIY